MENSRELHVEGNPTMTKRRSHMKVIIGACLGVVPLASACTAFAECAWVLWEQPKVGRRGDQYMLHTGHKSQEECETQMFRAAKLLADDGWAMKMNPNDVPRRGELHEAWLFKGNDSKRFSCFPDTIDPRGPKGK